MSSAPSYQMVSICSCVRGSWFCLGWGCVDAFHNSSSCQEQQQQQQLQKPVETLLCPEQKTHGKRENSLHGKANVISPDRLCRPAAAERREGRHKQPNVVLWANVNRSLAIPEQNVPSWAGQGTGLAGGNIAEGLARLPVKAALLGCQMKEVLALTGSRAPGIFAFQQG